MAEKKKKLAKEEKPETSKKDLTKLADELPLASVIVVDGERHETVRREDVKELLKKL